MNLEAKIEGLLFYKGEDIEIKKISELLKVSNEEVEESLKKLEENFSGRGLVIVRKNDSVMLGVSAELGPLIESIRKEDFAQLHDMQDDYDRETNHSQIAEAQKIWEKKIDDLLKSLDQYSANTITVDLK